MGKNRKNEIETVGDGLGIEVKDIVKDWMKEKQFILGTPENIESIMDECINSKRYALDLETTGLDNRVMNHGGMLRTVDRIVGVCLSPDGVKGYYIPLGHVEIMLDGSRVPLDCNIPQPVFDKAFRRLVKATETKDTTAVFHNGKFDQEFLEFHGNGESYGSWDIPSTWDDTLILAYLSDSRRRQKGLKYLSGELMKMEMIELRELFSSKSKLDFSVLDPRNSTVLRYAGSDAICTRLLYDLLAPGVLEPETGHSQKSIYAVEKLCVAATRWMERNRVHIDRGKVAELIHIGQKEWYASIMDVYKEAEKLLQRDVMPGIYKTLQQNFTADNPADHIHGQILRAEQRAKDQFPDPTDSIKDDNGREWPFVYDIESPQQLGVMFEEMGVEGLKKTEKSGQVKTSKDELNRIIEEAGEQFPFMVKIRRFREIAKALSTYLYPMWDDSDPSDDTMRINFQAFKVDTGRFSTPSKESVSDRDRDRMIGWPQINLQSIPRAGGTSRPECMQRLRETISVRRKGRYMVAADYSGVELRLVTNLSKEPLWMAEFFHCSGCGRTFDRGDGQTTPEPPPPRCPNCGSDKIGDLHTLTGISVYGKEAPSNPDWKELRGKAKGLNFALCYGGGGAAAQRATGVDRNEGNRMKRQFDATYRTLKNWWDSQHVFARKYGYVQTAFGRKYPVPDINDADGGFRSKAERNSVNGPIQGTSADITKIAMGLIYKEMKVRGWLDKCQMIITMHDELVFEIDGEVLEEAIKIIVPIMTRNTLILKKNWPIPLTSDVEMGYDWSVPWDLNGMKYGEVRFIGNKKYKDAKKLPEGTSWDALKSWPDELLPFFKAATEAPAASAQPQTSGEQVSMKDELSSESFGSGGDGIPAEDGVGNLTPPTESVDIPHEETQTKVTPPSVSPGVPDIPPGGIYEFRLAKGLTLETMWRLASVIKECQKGGTRVLRIQARDGTSLDKWTEFYGKGPVIVNHVMFYSLAQHYDLI